MLSLDTFYQSDEWRKLLKVLKQERTTDDGLICAYCGKPIVKAYDAIGHHITYLTDDNVADVNISLNPDNIQFVHHKCHNRIHHKLFNKREVFLVYGSPLSGKTTYVKSVIEPGDLIIDMDNIWECVSNCDRYIKPPRLNQIVFTMRDTLLDCVRVRKGKWNNCYIIGGYPLISERERLCKSLGAREIFIDTDKDTCLARLAQCEDRDKDEWATYIEKWWANFHPDTRPVEPV